MTSKYQIALAALAGFVAAQDIAPVAIFHGITSSCSRSQSWTDAVCQNLPEGTPCKCVEIGDGWYSSIFEKMDWQVATACRKLKTDPDYAGKEINVIGFSQGGLLARSVVERCDELTVHTLMTWGGPHQGVAEIPTTHGHWWSIPVNYITGKLVHKAIVQKLVAPADYFRTWWALQEFYKTSTFLPYINNEMPPSYAKNYKDNLTSVKNYALWMWTEDSVIIPRESSWFSAYDSHHKLIALRDSVDYQQDFVGMRTLDEAGKLWFYSGPGEHMYLTSEYVFTYLLPMLDDSLTPLSSEY